MRSLLITCSAALTLSSAASAQSGTVEVRFTGARPGGPVLVQLSTEAEFMRGTRLQASVAPSADGRAVARFTGAESIVRIEWSPCTSSS